MTKREIKKRLDEIEKEAATLRGLLDDKRRDQKLQCGWCGKRHAVRKLTLIQTHWYVEPYSCTGGDYWNQGEKQYECPSCGQRMRDLDRPWKDCDPKIAKLARYFKETIKEHKR